MNFIARVAAGSSKFLGRVHQGAKFIGRVAPQVGSAARSFSQVAHSGAVNDIAQKIGVGKVVRKLGDGADIASAAAGHVPLAAQRVGGLVNQAAQLAHQGKRDLGQLYAAANR